MLEKHWMGHQVDRSICAWFWKQAHPSVCVSHLEGSLVVLLWFRSYYLCQWECPQVPNAPKMGSPHVVVFDEFYDKDDNPGS